MYKRTVVARLDNDPEKLWDLDRPLEASCKLELLDFEDEQGKMVFWHSSAHILGEACERRFGCSLCIGPPIDKGFYYEMALPDGGSLHESDWEPIETLVKTIVKEKQKFERLELTKEDLLEMVGSGGRSHGVELRMLTIVPCLVQLQQVQAAHHQGQDPRRHLHHRLPKWPLDRSLPGTPCPRHQPHRGVLYHEEQCFLLRMLGPIHVGARCSVLTAYSWDRKKMIRSRGSTASASVRTDPIRYHSPR